MDVIEDENYDGGEDLYSDEARYLLNAIDPNETDHIILSEIVKLLTTHPARTDMHGSESEVEQISVLEKFVTKAIEQEESQKRIMIKLQEKIIEESKNEEAPERLSSLVESENILSEKNHQKEANFQQTNYGISFPNPLAPKQFENLENNVFEDLKNNYDNYEQYNANREEPGHQNYDTPDDKQKDVNYLHRDLDPVEEEEKEENSQRSLKDSQKHKISIEISDRDILQDEVPSRDYEQEVAQQFIQEIENDNIQIEE